MCVGLALCFAMMISGLTGATIPILFYRAGIDPAVASGPLITTVNDLVAVISYYGLAWFFLLKLNLIG
jgi:magnesium transporter